MPVLQWKHQGDMERIAPVMSCELFVTSYKKTVTRYGLRVTGFQSRIIVVLLFILLSPSVCHGDDVAFKVRKPVFAGLFYPADKTRLENTIDSYLKEGEQKSKKVTGKVFGIIVPHAGYEYSGKVAAFAYSQIKGKGYKTVILIGSNHRIPFRGIAIYPEGSWETPLGKVLIDHEVSQTIMNDCNFIRPFPAAFEREHSLEVQVPFLQRALTGFKIVPIVTGAMDDEDYRQLVNTLAGLMKHNSKNILIVASSDMSHFHTYDAANKMDDVALRDIVELNIEGLRRHLQKGECELCGAQGVLSLMMLANQINATATILNYANSGDVTKERSRVVGYCSAVFFHPQPDHGLIKKEQEILLGIARKTLEEHIMRGNAPEVDVNEPILLEKRGIFVTLKKNGSLRGCIGSIRPVAPIYKAVSDMTIEASTRDPRFPPVSRGELKNIRIEISVLSPFKLISDTNEIEVGKHGLYMIRGNNAGLLLPQVATEHKWNRDEFLRQTCVKAGLSAQAWKDKGTQIYTFSAQIFSEQ